MHNKNYRLLIVVSILLLAFALRVFDLDSTPPFVHWDEFNQVEQPRAVLSGEAPLLGAGYNGNPVMTYVQYVPALWFGANLWAVRVTSALWSMLVLALFYFGARQMFGPRTALCAVFLLASAHLFIQFGRAGLNLLPSAGTCFLAIGLYLKAERRRLADRASALLYFAAGAALAFNLYEYIAARALFFGMAAYWLFGVPRRREEWGAYARLTLALAAGMLLVAAPILGWYAEHPGDLLDRAQALSVFGTYGTTVNEQIYGEVDTPTLMLYQTLRSLGGFFVVGDTSPNYHFDFPLLDPLTAALLLPGLVLAWRADRRLTGALLVATAAGLVGGAILLAEPPSSVHYIFLIPLAIVFSAFGLARLAAGPAGRRLLPALLAAIALLNIYLYFFLYPYQGAWIWLYSDVGAYVRDTRGCCTVWYVGEFESTARAIAGFTAEPTPIHYVSTAEDAAGALADRRPGDPPAIVIVPSDTVPAVMPRLRQSLPGGSELVYTDRGMEMFHTYTLP